MNRASFTSIGAGSGASAPKARSAPTAMTALSTTSSWHRTPTSNPRKVRLAVPAAAVVPLAGARATAPALYQGNADARSQVGLSAAARQFVAAAAADVQQLVHSSPLADVPSPFLLLSVVAFTCSIRLRAGLRAPTNLASTTTRLTSRKRTEIGPNSAKVSGNPPAGTLPRQVPPALPAEGPTRTRKTRKTKRLASDWGGGGLPPLR